TAVRHDLQASPRSLQEELERPFPLLDPEQEPLARRPQSQQAVEPAPGEEVDVGAEGGLVDPVAVERRHGRGQGTTQHGATLRALDVGETVERAVDPGVVEPRPAVERVYL